MGYLCNSIQSCLTNMPGKGYAMAACVADAIVGAYKIA